MSLGALNVSYYISALRKKQAVKGRIFNVWPKVARKEIESHILIRPINFSACRLRYYIRVLVGR